MSDEIIKPPTTSNKRLAPELSYFGIKTRVKFNGSCLKQDKITYTFRTKVNIYIFYELNPNLSYNDVVLENCLFGEVELTSNADIVKCKYSGYGSGFDKRGTFSFPSGGFGFLDKD